jgi:hypothetical protein
VRPQVSLATRFFTDQRWANPDLHGMIWTG